MIKQVENSILHEGLCSFLVPVRIFMQSQSRSVRISTAKWSEEKEEKQFFTRSLSVVVWNCTQLFCFRCAHLISFSVDEWNIFWQWNWKSCFFLLLGIDDCVCWLLQLSYEWQWEWNFKKWRAFNYRWNLQCFFAVLTRQHTQKVEKMLKFFNLSTLMRQRGFSVLHFFFMFVVVLGKLKSLDRSLWICHLFLMDSHESRMDGSWKSCCW